MKLINAKAALSQVKAFVQDDEAATAAEYGILAALIAVAIITAVNTFSGSLQGMFTKMSNQISSK